MKRIELQLPDELDWNEEQLRRFIAVKLYESGKLSSGQAASWCGLGRRAFLEIVGEYGASIFQYGAGELKDDLNRVKNHLG